MAARPPRPFLAALLALALFAAGAAATLYLSDVDGDGLSTREELGWGTRWLASDTDQDGLADGFEATHRSDPSRGDTDQDGVGDQLEQAMGTDPQAADTDHDGVPDAAELAAGMDPRSPDSDGDGIPDAEEHARDCNGDGLVAAIQADDDADGRPDAEELPADRCRADADGDGILDGDEGATACVHAADCDQDGLPDSQETGPFSPLSGDSLGAGLPDAVTKVFSDRAAPASPDADHDGIPDAWESGTPPVAWDGFDPEPGRRDLLVEFLRLQGPSSRAYAGSVPFSPAYERVASLFAEGGITLSWKETLVDLPADGLAPLGLDVESAYYQAALAKAKFGGHPYVNVVVLNPHIDQSQVSHAGIGQLRGMLAAVDYSDAFLARARSAQGDSFSMRVLQEAEPGNWRAGSGDPPTLQVSGPTWNGAYATWQGYWFTSQPILVLPDGRVRPMVVTVELDTGWLAHVLAHEMGHNLGLCHTHDSECAAQLGAADRLQADRSTMSYNSGAALLFLPSEWATVRDYLACPPTGTLTALASGAPDDAVWAAKYVDDGDHRACGTFATLATDLVPVASPPRSYEAPAPAATETPAPLAVAHRNLLLAAGLVLLGTLAAGLGAWAWRKAKS